MKYRLFAKKNGANYAGY